LTHIVKGQSDDTIAEVAQLYFGSRDGAVNLVGSYNSQWKHYQAVNPGSSMVVPAYVTPSYYTATSATNGAGEIARKNGTTADRVRNLNPDKNFPVSTGTRVRVR
jgi:hypothetical protein